MVKFILGIILALVVIGGAAYALVDWAWSIDVRNAEADCSAKGARPSYTYRTRYVCVTPDGRVV